MAYSAKIITHSTSQEEIRKIDVMSAVKKIRRGEFPKDQDGKALVDLDKENVTTRSKNS